MPCGPGCRGRGGTRPGGAPSGLDDSKKLSPAERLVQATAVRAAALAVAWAFVGPRAIDASNIRRASLRAMFRASARARRLLRIRHPARAERLLLVVDGLDRVPGCDLPQMPLVAGDGTSRAVAAASVVAKVVRDGFMARLDGEYPAYGFARHKGYGTSDHLLAIEQWGPCAWHRLSFRPLTQFQLPFAPAPAI